MRWLVLFIGGLFVLSQLVFAQTADLTSTSIPELSEKETDNDDHQSIDGDEPPTVATFSRSSVVAAESLPPSSTSEEDSSSSAPSSISRHRVSRTQTPHSTFPHNHPFSFTGSVTVYHAPLPTSAPDPNRPPPFSPPATRASNRQSPVAIAFEVLAGIAGFIIILTLLRCGYSWKKTPRRDRIAALLSRHHLDREMEELEREQLQRRIRRSSLHRPPPPPYQPAPAYDAAVGDEHA